ncbi:TauD/TfdA family dioxygenase [Candidatus Pelagibacter sp.]|uniref:TauD/TfdA family dioxygenase n=1 Tax=Candidatus Pelagibacter sp. TaxID=2024849 RepID=UPI003F8753FB
MKIELTDNKVFFEKQGAKKEIHPFWLRERVNSENFLDQKTQQRLFDPTMLKNSSEISKVNISDKFLEVSFKDGAYAKLVIENILKEFEKDNELYFINKISWKSDFQNNNIYKFNKNFFEEKIMYESLLDFYKYGFVIFDSVPTHDNFIVNFANSIGSIRRTNFGEFFNVKSKPNPNDLAYTSLPLAPHTDNPYRKPVPCIQLLHCIENEVRGGLSTLVDGLAVTEELKKEHPSFFQILTEIKVRFQFVDDNVVLEDWAEMIQLDENKRLKQVRFSPRLDFVPLMDKEKLELYYAARNKISEMYNSEKFRIEFKLKPGDLLMMDNYRLLHGRTEYNANEGNRFLQGCYIDYDSTEGKLKHLKRKFNI